MDILKSHQKDLGGGLIVSRVLPGHPDQMVGPFIFFDQMGPMTAAPGQNVDVRPHPHIGLATVTWLFEGEMIHRDSLGVVQPIAPGDVNWMTSGRGIVHSAADLEAGATLTLPAEHEERGIHLVQGDILVDGMALPERNLAFASSGQEIRVQARTQSRVMLLGGEKMDGPRFIWWNFVASSGEKIEDGKRRWRERSFAAVPGESEFIPLPER